MLVSEQAVQAVPTLELTKALSRLAGNRHSDGVSSIVSADDRSVIINGCHDMMIALKAQGPLHERQGIKVKALDWHGPDYEDEYWASWLGGIYTIQANTDDGRWLGGVGGNFQSVEAAKAAAQADYEARIRSALEPFANSYPQGANLAAQSKNEDGSYKEPSPRPQALEEAAQVADKGSTAWLKKRDVTANKKEARDYETMAIACSHVAAAIRALSSQPVVDGWLPIETAPKDGTPVLAYQAGRYFKCWMECDQYEGGYFWQDEEDSEPSPTHWRPLPTPPSSEVA